LGLLFLKFRRGAERDADILGIQTMSHAGYDPRGMLAMFEKLERGGPQFLSDHPNPENRIKRIREEIERIGVPANAIESSRLYLQIRNRLRSMPPAPRLTPGG
jgi:predicted Zn-dependent protease